MSGMMTALQGQEHAQREAALAAQRAEEALKESQFLRFHLEVPPRPPLPPCAGSCPTRPLARGALCAAVGH